MRETATIDIVTACDAWDNAAASRTAELCESAGDRPPCPFEGPEVNAQMHYYCLLAIHDVTSCESLQAYGPECLICMDE